MCDSFRFSKIDFPICLLGRKFMVSIGANPLTLISFRKNSPMVPKRYSLSGANTKKGYQSDKNGLKG